MYICLSSVSTSFTSDAKAKESEGAAYNLAAKVEKEGEKEGDDEMEAAPVSDHDKAMPLKPDASTDPADSITGN